MVQDLASSLPRDKGESQSARIIRPTHGAGRPGGGGVELNLSDLQKLGEKLVQESRERVGELEARAIALEKQLAEGKARVERELEAAKKAADEEIARWKEARIADAEAARLKGFEAGQADGRVEGLAAGQQEGYRKGFEEGYAEGRQSGYREAQEAERTRIVEDTKLLGPTLQAMSREISDRRKALWREANEELLRLALEIARKVIKREVRECPEVVVLNVRKAIDLAFRRTALSVEVHPEDAAVIERYTPDILRAFAGLNDLTVRPSEDVGRGGCRVVSGSGIVDLRIDSQLEIIEQALFGRLVEADLDETPAAAPRMEEALP